MNERVVKIGSVRSVLHKGYSPRSPMNEVMIIRIVPPAVQKSLVNACRRQYQKKTYDPFLVEMARKLGYTGWRRTFGI